MLCSIHRQDFCSLDWYDSLSSFECDDELLQNPPFQPLAGRPYGSYASEYAGDEGGLHRAFSRRVYAKKAGIQKVIGYTRNGREVRLVTCKALREAGERHTDVAGADRDATARIAGHTVTTKERHYKKGNFEEDRKIVRGHHPLMRDSEGPGRRGALRRRRPSKTLLWQPGRSSEVAT